MTWTGENKKISYPNQKRVIHPSHNLSGLVPILKWTGTVRKSKFMKMKNSKMTVQGCIALWILWQMIQNQFVRWNIGICFVTL